MAHALVGRFDGYEDERFVEAVSGDLHCIICFNVLREPVMCQNNEHLYCRSCISTHLMTICHACPVCREHLTIQTLKLAPPSIQNLLDKLEMHCDYFHRGCKMVIQLGDLERHVADCGFAPAVCHNEGCHYVVNRQDKLHHETVECEYRTDREDVDTDKRLHEVTEQLGKMRISPETTADEKPPKNTVESVEIDREPKMAIAGGECDEGIVKSVRMFTSLDGTSVIILYVQNYSAGLRCCICNNDIKDPVMCPNDDIFCRACITERLVCCKTCPTCTQPLTIETLREAPEDIKDMLNELQLELPRCDKVERFKDKSLFEVKKQPERKRTWSWPQVDIDERLKKEPVESAEMVREPKIVIAGGECNEGILKSVRMFTLLHDTWVVAMQSMNECRSDASSVLHQSSIFVMGGLTPNGATASIEKLSLDTEENNQTRPENVPATLPSRLVGHCCAVYNQRLIVVGGYNAERSEYSDSITEISFVPPYVNELLATMPTRRCYHGVAIFGDRILIVGGRSGISSNTILRSVVMYDIIASEFQELAPLPYPVHSMAIVKWRDNVIIMGGVDRNRRPLNKVFMYNINAQVSHDLPNMNHKRKGCVAAIVEDAVIIMGGEDEEGNYLKSVEKFTFRNRAWALLPEMPEERNFATAIVY